MFRVTSLLTAVAFTVWILPLGFFIKPSQEKIACDGKRAMHMCSMMKGNIQKKASAGISFQNASGLDKGSKASAGSGVDDYLKVEKKVVFKNFLHRFSDFYLVTPSNPSLYRLDAVPKI